MSAAINENVIRWSEVRLPHPDANGQLLRWKVDGPFAVRSYYRVPGSVNKELIRLDLSLLNEDGTTDKCLHCKAPLGGAKVDAPWLKLIGLLVLGLGLAPFTFGLSVLAVAYPLWFLWGDAPRVQACGSCRAEFVDFRFGPRP